MPNQLRIVTDTSPIVMRPSLLASIAFVLLVRLLAALEQHIIRAAPDGTRVENRHVDILEARELPSVWFEDFPT